MEDDELVGTDDELRVGDDHVVVQTFVETGHVRAG